MRKTACISFVFLVLLAGTSPALTLKESVDIAVRNNPAVLAARKKSEAAGARLGQAVGAFLPNVSVSGNYGRSYTEPSIMQMKIGAVTQDIVFGTDAVQDSKGYALSATQPLFVAALFPGFRIAQKSADIAGEELKNAVIDVSFGATQAYFGVLAAEKAVKLSVESLEMASSHLEQVKAMMNAGVATRADILRAEVQYETSVSGLTRAKNELELAKLSFNSALGRDLAAAVSLKEEDLKGKVERVPEYGELLDAAFRHRPDWKKFILSKQIGEENLKLAYSNYFPQVMLSGRTGSQIVEYPSFRSDVGSWNITGNASFTLFDGLSTQNKVREARAELESQKASEEQVKNGIALEVRAAHLNLNAALDTVNSAKKAVEAAEEGVKVSTMRYNSGMGTNLEVIDAQVSLTRTKLNHLQSLFDIEIARAKLNKAAGREVI